MRGRTISIYLPDANPRGIKICDIEDSIVQAVLIPRSKIKDAYGMDELKEPGVYFLFGEKDDVNKPDLYIGEAESLIKRLKQHNASKEFWTVAICFSSHKGNLNKAHIKFLENHSFSEAQKANKCRLKSKNIPTKSKLTRKDQDFVLRFYDELKILLGTSGYPVLEEVRKEKKNLLICKGKDARAEGEYSEDGLTVFKGSKCNLKESKTAGSWVIGMRERLKEAGTLKQSGNVYVFTEDHTFSSPSAAAAVVLARRANGWIEWKDKSGKTIDEKLRKK